MPLPTYEIRIRIKTDCDASTLLDIADGYAPLIRDEIRAYGDFASLRYVDGPEVEVVDDSADRGAWKGGDNA